MNSNSVPVVNNGASSKGSSPPSGVDAEKDLQTSVLPIKDEYDDVGANDSVKVRVSVPW